MSRWREKLTWSGVEKLLVDDRMRKQLVKSACKNGIELRQTYERIGEKVLRSRSSDAKASQFRRARKATDTGV